MQEFKVHKKRYVIKHISFLLEATPGFEPGIRVLQTRALPLGYSADNILYVNDKK